MYMVFVQICVSKLLGVGMMLCLVDVFDVMVGECVELFFMLYFFVLCFDLIEQYGCLLLLLYIEYDFDVIDEMCYQIVYVSNLGVVVVLMVGFYFDQLLLEQFDVLGVECVMFMLYVGVGMFQLVCVDNIVEYKMYSEWYDLLQLFVDKIVVICVCGGNVIVVGMMLMCVFEVVVCLVDEVGCLFVVMQVEIDIFIMFGYCFCVVDWFVMNFYLLKLMLLMLVFVFVGVEMICVVYWYVIEECYWFFSYGDVMLFMWCDMLEVLGV